MALAAGFGLSAARADEGQQVYAAQRCSMCHAIAGKWNAKNPLDDVGGRMTADEMKAYPNLPAEDLDALVAYLGTLIKKGS